MFTTAAKHEISTETKNQQHHVHPDDETKFRNPWKEWKDPSSSIYNLLCFQKDMIKQSMTWSNDSFDLPLKSLDSDVLQSPTDSTSFQVTWIGHSTFLVQIDGLTVVTDPVFSHRCAPTQFVGPARLVPVPSTVQDLPTKVDMVIISHNHYDHLDYQSILDLEKHHEPTFFVPLRIKKWFIDVAGVAEERVMELDWWASAEHNQFKFTFLPAMHWSTRSVTDKNQTLWGSWSVTSLHSNKKFFFAGDTGYSSDLFKEIGNHEGPFDLALIPIGAYEPRWFMAPQHVNPSEAVQISLDIHANKSIGMHWGTFVLTTEPVMEPKLHLEKELQERGLPADYFVTMQHGQTISTNVSNNTNEN